MRMSHRTRTPRPNLATADATVPDAVLTAPVRAMPTAWGLTPGALSARHVPVVTFGVFEYQLS